jgi:hypothetical protein
MGAVDTYRRIIQKVLCEYVGLSYANGDIQNEAVFDHENDRYLIMSVV